MQSTIKAPLSQPIAFLQTIIANGGPETIDYESLNIVIDKISDEFKAGKITDHQMQELQAGFGDDCLDNTLLGHVKSKPYGYPGDFMIIDKIYREQVTTDHRFSKWDTFWNNHSAARAVRNRKDYFIETMTNRLAGKTIRLLNVASGPARDLAELYNAIKPGCLQTVCIEADQEAIRYAEALNKNHQQHIRFVHQNIFKFTTNETFDITWSAGLFDYFEDSVFVKLLRRFVGFTNKGGEIIIGNFSKENPSRNYMELLGDWYLHHRSEEELTGLALEAGIPRQNIRVGSELEGVNLFLHLTV